MVDFNNFEDLEGSLLPDNLVCRAVMLIQPGEHILKEFSNDPIFGFSQEGKAWKWFKIEFTVVGGQYDKRKFWTTVFVDGEPNADGINWAKPQGMSTIRRIVDSAFNLDPRDTGPDASQKRNLPNGVSDFSGKEICVVVGIEKGRNGNQDSNKLKKVLLKTDKNFIGSNGQSHTPISNNQPINTTNMATNNTTNTSSSQAPAWARNN